MSESPPRAAPARLRRARLRDLGLTSWFLLGCLRAARRRPSGCWAAAVTIVGPLVVATIVATVAMPLVAWLQRHRVPRVAGAALVLVGLVAIAALIVVLVIGGITGQQGRDLRERQARRRSGRSPGSRASASTSRARRARRRSVKSDVPKIIATLVEGRHPAGCRGSPRSSSGSRSPALSTFFLLKDGPSMRRWVDRHLGVPQPVGQTITGGVIRSLRGYFRGVTIVAVLQRGVVALGALVLGRAARRDDRRSSRSSPPTCRSSARSSPARSPS